jgi:hypothetical protein
LLNDIKTGDRNMKAQKITRFRFIVYFILISLIVAGHAIAQDRNHPPTTPPVTEKTGEFTVIPVTNKPLIAPLQKVNSKSAGSPITDKPPTNPPQAANRQSQVLDSSADVYPPPPPPVERHKPVLGGPVNDKLTDPPTGPPDKTRRGIKKMHVNIPSRVGKKDVAVQIDTTKKQGSSLRTTAIQDRTIPGVSPKERVEIKKETKNILLPERKTAIREIKIDSKAKKSLPARSLKKQKTVIPKRKISMHPEK